MSGVGHVKYEELVNVPKLRRLMERLSQALGTANGITGIDESAIIRCGWQKACTDFHRANPKSCRRCQDTGAVLSDALVRGLPYAVSSCRNGLVEAAAPIVVGGRHVASVRTGQFLTSSPDIEFFRAQANEFGFDETRYLEAIADVPIVPQERVEELTRLYAELAAMLADSGLDRLRSQVANEQLEREIAERKAAETSAVEFAARLRTMTRRYTDARESESRSLARELHDRVSSSLTAIGLNLELIERKLLQDADSGVRELLTDTTALVEDTISNARNISQDLHPAVLDYCGVVAAIENFVQRSLRQAGIAVTVSRPDPEIRLAPEKEIALYRIAQEALTNCAKHSNAKNITVEFSSRPGHATLVIADDGVGFTRTTLGADNTPSGLGLLAMQERAQAVGGRLTLESAVGQGTRITVST